MDDNYAADLTELLLQDVDGNPDHRLNLLYQTSPDFKNGIDLIVRVTPALVGVIAEDSERAMATRNLLLRVAQIGVPDIGKVMGSG
jgi:hypothetical protein